MNARIALLIVLALTTMGCSQDAASPMQANPRVLIAVPADGATAVRLDAAVTLNFGTVVDRATVERGVHLLAERDMFSSCPDTAMGDHGSMESVMDDGGMLRHMDEVHSTQGTFSWNATGTTCTLRPDSLMAPQARYMVHMSGETLDMMSQMGIAMSGGRMSAMGDMMLHFETTTADDHGGHH